MNIDNNPYEFGFFIWRGSDTEISDQWNQKHKSEDALQILGEITGRKEPVESCNFCGSHLYEHKHSYAGGRQFSTESSGLLCRVCGWAARYKYYTNCKSDQFEETVTGERIMRWFSPDNPNLTIEEIGSVARRNFDTLYDIHPRKFEELVSEIYARQGYVSELTKSSRDGGYDVMLFDKNGEKSIVEVKRYRGKVGVGIVRALRGVQLEIGVPTARIVTTSFFTSPAEIAASSSRAENIGFTLTLHDAGDLLRALDVFQYDTISLEEFDEFRKIEIKNKELKNYPLGNR